MNYVLDSSALVDAWTKWYSPDSIPRFWEDLENLGRQKIATIPDAVLFELSEVDDGLFKWCKERENFIITQSTLPIQEIIKYVSNTYKTLRNAGTPSKNFADPVVIAMAINFHCAVVTHEQARGNLNGPRIPDVCRLEHVRVMQIHHLVREQKWSYK